MTETTEYNLTSLQSLKSFIIEVLFEGVHHIYELKHQPAKRERGVDTNIHNFIVSKRCMICVYHNNVYRNVWDSNVSLFHKSYPNNKFNDLFNIVNEEAKSRCSINGRIEKVFRLNKIQFKRSMSMCIKRQRTQWNL